MQSQAHKDIPTRDEFLISAFDIVIHHNRELGRGGFGEVFEGHWRGTKVAIKRIRAFHPAVSRIIDSFNRYSYLPSWVKTRSRS